MGILFKDADIQDDIFYLLKGSQDGDREARELLIQKYTPFILKIVSKTCGRYIYLGQDDEASIGLLAFDEAIDSFNLESNNSFLSFAELVIKRRLIDYFRKEKRGEKIIQLSLSRDHEEGEQSNQWALEGKLAFDSFSREEEAKARKEEILYFNKVLQGYGFSFRELVEISPKHQDARVNAIKVAKLIAENQELKNKVLSKKLLPLKDIEKLVEVSRKTLERNRKYIIAVFLILTLDLTYLREYLKQI